MLENKLLYFKTFIIIPNNTLLYNGINLFVQPNIKEEPITDLTEKGEYQKTLLGQTDYQSFSKC